MDTERPMKHWCGCETIVFTKTCNKHPEGNAWIAMQHSNQVTPITVSKPVWFMAFILLTLFAISSAQNWTLSQDGQYVSWSNANALINCTATSHELISQTQICNFTYTGATPLTLNTSLAFNLADGVTPKRAYLWQNISHTLYHEVSTPANHSIIVTPTSIKASTASCDWGAGALKYNLTFSGGNSTVYCFDTFQNNSGTYTLWSVWNDSVSTPYTAYFYDWSDITSAFSVSQFGSYKVGTVQATWTQGTTRTLKFEYETKPNTVGKFDIYFHTGSAAQAVADPSKIVLALDPWWNSTWNNKVQVNVTGWTCSAAFCQFAIPIDLNEAKTNGSDIRILDSTESTQLSFWREDGWNYGAAAGNIWVNASNASTIFYVYYNATGVSDLSNINITFVFADDFSSYDTAKWNNCTTATKGGVSFAGGYATFYETAEAGGCLNTSAYNYANAQGTTVLGKVTAFTTAGTSARSFIGFCSALTTDGAHNCNGNANAWFQFNRYNDRYELDTSSGGIYNGKLTTANLPLTVSYDVPIANATATAVSNIIVKYANGTQFNITGPYTQASKMNMFAIQVAWSQFTNITYDYVVAYNTNTSTPTFAIGAEQGINNPTVAIQTPTATTHATTSIPLNYTTTNAAFCWYKLNGGANTTLASCANTTITGVQGVNNLTVYANNTSNVLASASVSFTVDTIPPILTIQLPANTTYTATNRSLNFTAIDANLAFCQYSLNGAANISLPGCVNTTFTAAQGGNTITVYANDTLGNLNSSTVSFFVDSINPAVAIQTPANTTYATTSIPFNFTATDTNRASCWYILDAGANTTLASCANITLTSLGQGSHTLALWVNDTLNNRNSSSVTFFVDSINPAVAIQNPTNTTYTNTTVAFAFTATDANLGSCWYVLNGGAPQDIVACANGTITASVGGNTLVIYANDTAGNSNSSTVIFSVFIVSINITISSPLSQAYNVSMLHLTYTVANNTPVGACWATINSGSPQYLANCQNTTITSLSPGSYTIVLRANSSMYSNIVSSAVSFTIASGTSTNPPYIPLITPPPAIPTDIFAIIGIVYYEFGQILFAFFGLGISVYVSKNPSGVFILSNAILTFAIIALLLFFLFQNIVFVGLTALAIIVGFLLKNSGL